MKKVEVIVGGIALTVVAGVMTWAFIDRAPQSDRELEKEVTAIETEEGGNTVKTEQASDIRSIVEEFTQLYIQAVRHNDESAAQQAREYLTERGKTVIDTDGNTWSGLRRFMLRLEAPDRIEIGEVVKKADTFAEAVSTWHYPDRTETYYFYFTLEQNRWRIDSIQSVQQ